MLKGKEKRASYHCSEFADSLLESLSLALAMISLIHSVNHANRVIYRTHYSSTTIVQWDKHVEETCKVPETSQHMYVCYLYIL